MIRWLECSPHLPYDVPARAAGVVSTYAIYFLLTRVLSRGRKQDSNGAICLVNERMAKQHLQNRRCDTQGPKNDVQARRGMRLNLQTRCPSVGRLAIVMSESEQKVLFSRGYFEAQALIRGTMPTGRLTDVANARQCGLVNCIIKNRVSL